MFDDLVAFLRNWYDEPDLIPLHAPLFGKSDRDYVLRAIDSTYVSSVGEFGERFEEQVCRLTGAPAAVVTGSGTAALQVALRLAGVKAGDDVITQPLTFVATANAISYLGATPVFVDVDRDTMGLSPEALERFLQTHGEKSASGTLNRHSGRRIAAVVPMHTHGRPCRIAEICRLTEAWGLPVVEDAAEALGSTRDERHCGTFGLLGVYSFNGNKTITTGGGGMIVTNNELGARARHLTTTAKSPHRWETAHDSVGYNFRMPNLNAALGCAQMEKITGFISEQRQLAAAYAEFFADKDWANFIGEFNGCYNNFWLNTVILTDPSHRNSLLEATNDAGVQTRPLWKLMHDLPMYRDCQQDGTPNARWLEERVVNLPSGAREGEWLNREFS